MPPEEASSGVGRDVGQQRLVDGAVIASAVAEDHVGEFVEDELLSVECGVGAGVEHEIIGIGCQPERAEAVVGIEISQLNDSKPAVPLVLDRAE